LINLAGGKCSIKN